MTIKCGLKKTRFARQISKARNQTHTFITFNNNCYTTVTGVTVTCLGVTVYIGLESCMFLIKALTI